MIVLCFLVILMWIERMLRNFVRGFENALSKDLCSSLIEYFESEPDIKTKEANRETRKDKQIWLPEDSELYNPVQKVKLDMLREYCEEFPYAYRGARKLLTPEIKIQRTNPMGGGFHNFHAEISHWENCTRALVSTIYLNDVPKGEGETEFLYDKIRIEPKEGMGCIFPAAWMYQHRGNPVHTHQKYIATGWYWYPEEPPLS